MATPVTVSAAVVDNANLASPGVYFGTGNPNGAFTVNSEAGVELGLRGKISGIFPQITPTGNTYFIPLGATFNFDYSVNPNFGGVNETSNVSLLGVTASITVTNLGNGQVGPTTQPMPALRAVIRTARSSFGFLNQLYNPNLDDAFDIVMTLSGVPGSDGPIHDEIFVQVGSGVPEPSTWAMILLGFAGLGLMAYLSMPKAALMAA